MSPAERAKVLLEAEPNSWVAFSEDESMVVGQAATYDEAVAVAEKQGIFEPVLVKVPDSWSHLWSFLI